MWPRRLLLLLLCVSVAANPVNAAQWKCNCVKQASVKTSCCERLDAAHSPTKASSKACCLHRTFKVRLAFQPCSCCVKSAPQPIDSQHQNPKAEVQQIAWALSPETFDHGDFTDDIPNEPSVSSPPFGVTLLALYCRWLE